MAEAKIKTRTERCVTLQLSMDEAKALRALTGAIGIGDKTQFGSRVLNVYRSLVGAGIANPDRHVGYVNTINHTLD